MRARPPRLLLAGLLALASLSAAAAGWDAGRVSDWFSHLDSFHARFSQRVTDADGKPVQTSEGEVWIKRPGRFRWNYERPFEQQVVADGRHLWTYDPELEQATVKPIGDVLGVTPAALLSGVQPFAEMVTVGGGERQGDEVLFRLRPRQPGDEVSGLQVGFRGDSLVLIRLHDSFGNTTEIRFSDEQVNVPIDAARFRVELPEDTDILGVE